MNMENHKLLALLTASVIGASGILPVTAPSALASEHPAMAKTQPSMQPVSFKLNSHPAPFTQSAVVVDGVLFVPFRELFELFEGAAVSWDPALAAASATIRSRVFQAEVLVTIGQRKAMINGKDLPLEQPVRLMNEVTMVPIQRLGEALGARLEWNETKSTALLARKGMSDLLKREARTGPAEAFPVPKSLPDGAGDMTEQQRLEWIDRYLSDHHFNGAVLIATDGEVQLSKGYGLEAEGSPNDPHTRFRLMSVSKQFTAAAILQLEEKGKLNVQDPVGRYVKGLPYGEKVSLHHLLSHTSGIPREYDRSPDYTLERLAADLQKRPLEFEPGTKYGYSNSAYALLAYVIEQVSGQSYGDYLQDHLFQPLGMKESGQFIAAAPPERMAQGYWNDGEKLRKDAPHFSLPGGGDLYSSVGDLHLWDRAMFAGTLLQRASVDKLHSPNLNNYAYGLHTGKEGSYYHEGSGNGFSTFVYRHPEQRRSIILLSNVVDIEIDDLGIKFAELLK